MVVTFMSARSLQICRKKCTFRSLDAWHALSAGLSRVARASRHAVIARHAHHSRHARVSWLAELAFSSLEQFLEKETRTRYSPGDPFRPCLPGIPEDPEVPAGKSGIRRPADCLRVG